MPAAAVIPAPLAYIKFVAVKTHVVVFLSGVTDKELCFYFTYLQPFSE